MIEYLKKNLRAILKSNLPTPESGETLAGTTDYSRRKAIVKKAVEAQHALAYFVAPSQGSGEFLSLGQNCSTAWYLKELGVKDASYPFDWIFSSTNIVEHCIDTCFEEYLNPDNWYDKPDGSAGHKLYHGSFFNHRNPGRSAADKHYYTRCCQRFMDRIQSGDPLFFLVTLINEHEKRHDWATGFTEQFELPLEQNVETIRPLMKKLSSMNENVKFIVIDHYTNDSTDITHERLADNLFVIRFNAEGTSNGVRYTYPQDDFYFKLVLSGLTFG